MNYLKFLTVISIAVFIGACWSSGEENTSSKSENANTYNSQETGNQDISKNNETGTVPEANDENEEVDVPKIETYDPPVNKKLSPTETLKTYNLASINKNPERIKSLISKGSIQFITQKAKEEGLTFNEMIIKGKGVPAFETTRISNEKITGDTASVEIKFNDRDGFDTVPFVKEEGVWKIDFVKFFKDIITKTNY